MAKSSFSLLVDFQDAKHQAEKLEEIAEKVGRGRGELQECRNKISSDWKGDSSNEFLRKVISVEQDLKKIEKNLIRVADVIRQTAKKTYDTEKAALEIVKTRNL